MISYIRFTLLSIRGSRGNGQGIPEDVHFIIQFHREYGDKHWILTSRNGCFSTKLILWALDEV